MSQEIPRREQLERLVQDLIPRELATLQMTQLLTEAMRGWLTRLALPETEAVMGSGPEERLDHLRRVLWDEAWRRCGGEQPPGHALSCAQLEFRGLLCFDQTLLVTHEFFGTRAQARGQLWRREREDAVQEVQIMLDFGTRPCAAYGDYLQGPSDPRLSFGPFLRNAIRFRFRKILAKRRGDATLLQQDPEQRGGQVSSTGWVSTAPSAYRQLRRRERTAAFQRLLERVRVVLARRYAGDGQPTPHQQRRLELQLELLAAIDQPEDALRPILQEVCERLGCQLESLQRDMRRLKALVRDQARRFPDRTLLSLSTGSFGG